jgi:hypothetical protein
MGNGLIDEFRTDFQIPPYISDDSLQRYAYEGEAALGCLVLGADFSNDLEARGLLKNYMYYAHNHVVNEFFENYKSDILRWQWHHELNDGTGAEEGEGE